MKCSIFTAMVATFSLDLNPCDYSRRQVEIISHKSDYVKYHIVIARYGQHLGSAFAEPN